LIFNKQNGTIACQLSLKIIIYNHHAQPPKFHNTFMNTPPVITIQGEADSLVSKLFLGICHLYQIMERQNGTIACQLSIKIIPSSFLTLQNKYMYHYPESYWRLGPFTVQPLEPYKYLRLDWPVSKFYLLYVLIIQHQENLLFHPTSSNPTKMSSSSSLFFCDRYK